MRGANVDERVVIIHDAVFGRMRLRANALYRNDRTCRAVTSVLREQPGVERVSANPLTATVLVVYAAKRPEEIRAIVERAVQAESRDARTGDPPHRRESLWHMQSPSYAIEAMRSDAKYGLSTADVDERSRTAGPNALSVQHGATMWELVRGQLANLPTVLLIATSVASIVTSGAGEAIVILAVVGLNAGIGVQTERKATRVVEALTSGDLPDTTVIRNGVRGVIPARQLVPGDLLVVTRGTWIAADARLVEARDLAVDESALTGESVPVFKSAEALDRAELALGDRTCMLYRGTLVTGGSGRAVVVAIGDATEAGHIHTLVQNSAVPRTPLQVQLDQLGRQMVGVAGVSAAATLVAGLVRGQPLLAIVRATTALAIAAIPEGLPTVATMALATGLHELGKDHVLFRRLEAVEAIGAVQVMCLDKTGTITTGRMRVVMATTGTGRTDSSDAPRELLEITVLCNEARLELVNGQVHRLEGSGTESAMVEYAMQQGVDVPELRARIPMLRLDQRADQRMYMVTRHSLPDGRHLVAVKGRSDIVLARSRWRLEDGREVELTDKDRTTIETTNERMAGRAWRVLGVAYRVIDPDSDDTDVPLVWLGLIALEDPIRPGMKELIADLRRAGIRTVMITGDQSATAVAIARELGLADGEELEILDSARLDRIDPDVLAGLVRGVHVVSRVNPAHKLRIVRALQSSGLVVAMTGDGINDGPALRGADVGITIGRTGTDIARQVADVVLQSDDMPSILKAIAHGRTLRTDLRKAVHFIAATNLSEIVFLFSSLAAGLGLPLNPKQLLWINLVTDVFPELALAVEPSEHNVLERAPENPRAPLISSADPRHILLNTAVMTSATMAGFLYSVARYGAGPRAGTVGFNTLLASQLLHSISARSQNHSIFEHTSLAKNRYMTYAVAGGFVLQLLGQFSPRLRNALGSVPLDLADIGMVGALAGGSFVTIEAMKHARISNRARTQ